MACLSPVQSDTWWHLRCGEEMLRNHRLLFVDTFSSTVYGQFFWNHSWLSQIIFYGVYRAGGLPLLTAFCAALITTAWLLIWSLMRGPFADRLLLAGLALSTATWTWSVRPQVFSLFLTTLVLWLLTRDRWTWLVPLFVLWANLHAGFMFGLALLCASVLQALVSERGAIWRRSVWTLLCFSATLLTPLGVRNWTEVVASMQRSQVNDITEWLPTSLAAEHLAFWGMAGTVLVLAVVNWRRLESSGDRFLAIAAVLAIPLAAKSMRNVPGFAMIFAPATSRLLLWKDRQPPTRVSPWLVATAGVCSLAVVSAAWSVPWERMGWQPMSPAAADAIARCRPALFNSYSGGGAIIWFVPSQPVFVDSRQDPFPVELVQAGKRADFYGDYQPLFDERQVNCAAISPRSPLVARLLKDGWHARYSDSQWTVLER
jgi:hypothetical protein